MLYVPSRNQPLLRTTLPTGFNFVPLAGNSAADAGAGTFASNFASVGTLDDNAYLCIKAALEFRKKLRWNSDVGEVAVMNYTRSLAREGGKVVASILGTDVLNNASSTLVNCSMVNVRLPLHAGNVTGGNAKEAERIAQWMMKCMIIEYQTAVNIYYYSGNWWARLSAQVYNTLSDFELAGKRLMDTCERASKDI